MIKPSRSSLPLLLFETPPGLELILSQEGIAFRTLKGIDDPSRTDGRFVLIDSCHRNSLQIVPELGFDQHVIDIDGLRRSEPFDPFEALIDDKAMRVEWQVGRWTLAETVSRHAKQVIRERLIDQLRSEVLRQGGVWARLVPYPYPYESAFNFRVDLDEDNPDDYRRFAELRRPIEDCTTHFVSTNAYARHLDILNDLKRFDTQSHGHFHHIYDERESNRRNIQKADNILRASNFDLKGFCAPHGRWNCGLNDCLESLGYEYSSEFQLGYDDFPYYPWISDRFSKVLQIPIHPVCEGLFFDAGSENGNDVADYFAQVLRSRIANGLPAFLYGHPERRLARYPEVLRRIAEEVERSPSRVWRVTLTAFANWWCERAGHAWQLIEVGDHSFEVTCNSRNSRFTPGLEIYRADGQRAVVPLSEQVTRVRLDELSFESKPLRFDPAFPRRQRPSFHLKGLIRQAVDWETVTPIDELPIDTRTQRLKKRLRAWKTLVSEPRRGSA